MKDNSEMHNIKVKDHAFSGEDFLLNFNSDYHLYKTTPIPANLSEFYPKENYISHNDKKRDLVSTLYRIVKGRSLVKKEKLCFSVLGKRGSIIDFGAGNGQFVAQLQKKFWKTQGVEPSAYAREMAKKNSIELKETLSHTQDDKVDVITLWHVLEHIEDYSQAISSFHDKLNDQGFLILALPNYKSFDAKHYQSFWAAYDVPRHLWHFSKKSIERIAAQHNFMLVTTKPMVFDAFYICYLSSKYKNESFPLLRGIALGLRSNLSGLFSGEYSSMIYILQKR